LPGFDNWRTFRFGNLLRVGNLLRFGNLLRVGNSWSAADLAIVTDVESVFNAIGFETSVGGSTTNESTTWLAWKAERADGLGVDPRVQ
jgi:hypothetical protein